MKAKRFIQYAWVIEIAVLILNFLGILYWGSPGQMTSFLDALPLLIKLIVTQGIVAGAGPELKRWIEAKKNGGGT